MAVAIKDVAKWIVLRGVAHAVASSNQGYHHIACGDVTPNGRVAYEVPARICKECRHALRQAFVHKSDLAA